MARRNYSRTFRRFSFYAVQSVSYGPRWCAWLMWLLIGVSVVRVFL